MPITLYDLAGADPGLRFSPYCWRVKFALAHKGLAFETIPWHFTETAKLAFSGQAKVPVLVDGERVIADSWTIATYLDETYPRAPALFAGGGAAHARFINAWADAVLQPAIARVIVRDILDVLRPEDQKYFRQSRERAFGMPLEEVVADREANLHALRRAFTPLRQVLKGQAWLGGAAPDYADYIVLGSLQWPCCSSRCDLFDGDDPVRGWQGRGLELFNRLGANARLI